MKLFFTGTALMIAAVVAAFVLNNGDHESHRVAVPIILLVAAATCKFFSFWNAWQKQRAVDMQFKQALRSVENITDSL